MAQAPGSPGGGDGSGGSSGSSPWWIIYTLAAAQAETAVPHYVQAARPGPQAGQSTRWGTIEWVFGPYATLADAQHGYQGSGTPPASKQTSAAGGLPSGLTAIGDFFARLGQANTWIRVGEAVLGLILLAIGIARITHAVPAATRVARTAGAAVL